MKNEGGPSVCIFVCACVFCICGHAHVQHVKERPEVDLGTIPQAQSILFFETGTLIALELTMHARLAAQKNPRDLPIPAYPVHTPPCPNLYMDSRA